MRVPLSNGLRNYYQASLVSGSADVEVLPISIDALALAGTVRLIKIDVERHELQALNGMADFIQRDRPILIVETFSREPVDWLARLGYATERLPDSSNVLCEPNDASLR